jgi:ribonuclease HII
MQTTSIGKQAEKRVAAFLVNEGYQILAQNWRTKLCEIDIVARKNGTVFFVEVKYRSQQNQGDGFKYITSKKLKQMQFAAEIWNQQNHWEGDWQLVAVAATDSKIEIVFYNFNFGSTFYCRDIYARN